MFDFDIFTGKEKVVEVKNNVNESPKVSVCVQTYNHENYIRECLDSILNQKVNFPFEILLGEDNSNDETREICKEYANKYPDIIRLVLHDRSNVIYLNNQPSGRYNFMYNLSLARGEYVSLCEGDDFWIDECKLQKQFDYLQAHKNINIVGTNCIVVDENSKVIGHNRWEEKGYEVLLTPTVMFRKVTLTKEEQALFFKINAADAVLFSILSDCNKSYLFSSEYKSACYRIHAGGIWSMNSDITKYKKSEADGLLLYDFYQKHNRQDKSLHYFYAYMLALNNITMTNSKNKMSYILRSFIDFGIVSFKEPSKLKLFLGIIYSNFRLVK